MRRFLFALAILLFSACASGPDIRQTLDKVDPVVEAAELQLNAVAAVFEPAQSAAHELCATFAETCEPLARAEETARQAMDGAALALADYRAGRLAAERLADVLDQASGWVSQYAGRLASLQRLVADAPGADAGVELTAAPNCTPPLKPKLVCVGSFCFYTCQR